jgi:hypothetical protein
MEKSMQKKKLILHVDPKVFAAVRQQAFEKNTFRSALVESILADALQVKIGGPPCQKKESAKV